MKNTCLLNIQIWESWILGIIILLIKKSEIGKKIEINKYIISIIFLSDIGFWKNFFFKKIIISN